MLKSKHRVSFACIALNLVAQPSPVVSSAVNMYHLVELQAYARQAKQATRRDEGRSIRLVGGANDERKKKLHKVTEQQQVHFNELFAAWIAHHFCPMIIVEDEGFIAVIGYITEDISGRTNQDQPRDRSFGCGLSNTRTASTKVGYTFKYI
ncbi:Chemotaxis protein [Phytophthora palmivora]|uniref:Chemotaxis protein n=1 Tax=Phytophthora palmivora TaxID=4796 RepID=A0A2P4X042_9STRA|nr:Chemotaxis protein [Phytophthora palmivora]